MDAQLRAHRVGAVTLATPFSFAANKLWAFADSTCLVGPRSAPLPVSARERRPWG